MKTHILYEGLPLCGFMDAEPAFWPPEHDWVGPGEITQANCETCIDELSKLVKKIVAHDALDFEAAHRAVGELGKAISTAEFAAPENVEVWRPRAADALTMIAKALGIIMPAQVLNDGRVQTQHGLVMPNADDVRAVTAARIDVVERRLDVLEREMDTRGKRRDIVDRLRRNSAAANITAEMGFDLQRLASTLYEQLGVEVDSVDVLRAIVKDAIRVLTTKDDQAVWVEAASMFGDINTGAPIVTTTNKEGRTLVAVKLSHRPGFARDATKCAKAYWCSLRPNHDGVCAKKPSAYCTKGTNCLLDKDHEGDCRWVP